jgi:hypothetical protein
MGWCKVLNCASASLNKRLSDVRDSTSVHRFAWWKLLTCSVTWRRCKPLLLAARSLLTHEHSATAGRRQMASVNLQLAFTQAWHPFLFISNSWPLTEIKFPCNRPLLKQHKGPTVCWQPGVTSECLGCGRALRVHVLCKPSPWMRSLMTQGASQCLVTTECLRCRLQPARCWMEQRHSNTGLLSQPSAAALKRKMRKQ